mmetsp:Transcript_6957/g.12296  ORF Transcript_6957/g.12296 Transcript_6957/m.12296 type:complete len:284 (+) Transcript_6957:918-1769(+)
MIPQLRGENLSLGSSCQVWDAQQLQMWVHKAFRQHTEAWLHSFVPGQLRREPAEPASGLTSWHSWPQAAEHSSDSSESRQGATRTSAVPRRAPSSSAQQPSSSPQPPIEAVVSQQASVLQLKGTSTALAGKAHTSAGRGAAFAYSWEPSQETDSLAKTARQLTLNQTALYTCLLLASRQKRALTNDWLSMQKSHPTGAARGKCYPQACAAHGAIPRECYQTGAWRLDSSGPEFEGGGRNHDCTARRRSCTPDSARRRTCTPAWPSRFRSGVRGSSIVAPDPPD